MITVTIQRETLLEHDACADGLALYDALAAMQGDPACLTIQEWGPLHWAWAASCGHGGLLGWCADKHMLPMANLSGADLRGADLSGAYLARADLRGADLSGAYLTRADLTGADLTGADLSGAYLTRADLSGADLTRADLSGAYRGTSPAPDGWRVNARGYLERAA